VTESPLARETIAKQLPQPIDPDDVIIVDNQLFDQLIDDLHGEFPDEGNVLQLNRLKFKGRDVIPGRCVHDLRTDDSTQMQAAALNQLSNDNIVLKSVGAELCTAALRVATEYDGTHRLLLAVAKFIKAMADEHGRGDS
jgi:hypothetical protein